MIHCSIPDPKSRGGYRSFHTLRSTLRLDAVNLLFRLPSCIQLPHEHVPRHLHIKRSCTNSFLSPHSLLSHHQSPHQPSHLRNCNIAIALPSAPQQTTSSHERSPPDLRLLSTESSSLPATGGRLARHGSPTACSSHIFEALWHLSPSRFPGSIQTAGPHPDSGGFAPGLKCHPC